MIKGLELDIPKHTKVGVVGRTGSGKSTLAKLLFRFLELVGGSIMIDGITYPACLWRRCGPGSP